MKLTILGDSGEGILHKLSRVQDLHFPAGIGDPRYCRPIVTGCTPCALRPVFHFEMLSNQFDLLQETDLTM
jgi:hypothetical protein